MITSLLEKWKLMQTIFGAADLSATAKVVAGRLLEFHNNRTGLCCPSYQGLADGTGLRRRATIGAVQKLEERGWITVDRVKGGAAAGNRYATNSIRFDFSRAAETLSTVPIDALSTVPNGAPSTVQDQALLRDDNSAQSGAPTVHETALSTVPNGAPEPTNLSTKEPTKDSPPTPSRQRDVGRHFDELWQLWPRKDNEAGARQAYRLSLRQGATAREIHEGAERHVASLDPAEASRFAPGLMKWLSLQRWNEQPESYRASRAQRRGPVSMAEAMLEAGEAAARNMR